MEAFVNENRKGKLQPCIGASSVRGVRRKATLPGDAEMEGFVRKGVAVVETDGEQQFTELLHFIVQIPPSPP